MRPLRASLAVLIIPVTQSLLVVPSSPQCASLCGNSLSSTSGDEITCSDGDYATSPYGATFKACIACELTSPYYDTAAKQADLQWALYNMRYALSWCLFGFNNNTKLADTPCLTSFSCAPLQSAFEFDGLNPNSTEYAFCPQMINNRNSISSCSECLSQTGRDHYLSNFIIALEAACIQQPIPGKTVSLDGSVFSSTRVNITSPSSIPTGTFTPATGLTLGAKIGIAVAGIFVLLFILGFCIIWRGKRRRRAVLAEHQKATGYADWHARQGPSSPFFDSPQSQRPLTHQLSWDQHAQHFPESAGAEKAYFSPYSSQYNSPVSAVDARTVPAWPADAKMARAEEEEPGERIEMVGVGGGDPRTGAWTRSPPPVLQHPGGGRGASSLGPPQTEFQFEPQPYPQPHIHANPRNPAAFQGSNEDDMKKGIAV